MELALGTVQFGMSYGIAGRNAPVPEAEVRSILAYAYERGCRNLDTASVYGDIELRLASLTGPRHFSIISKIRPRPELLSGRELADWGTAEMLRSIERIGPSLHGLMFHHHHDLLDVQGEGLWHACAQIAQERGVKLGVSCYEPEALQAVCARFPIAVAQLPSNALDQRLASLLGGTQLPPELHVRSVFLQGLLLMPIAKAQARVPIASNALLQWHRWCANYGLSPLVAALGFVKGIANATHCIVGVDSLAQLKEIANAWDEAPTLKVPDLAEPDLRIIDPRLWTSVAR
jgi:aryl-alcohol dehydrogenase-like predicted oxidoreductase